MRGHRGWGLLSLIAIACLDCACSSSSTTQVIGGSGTGGSAGGADNGGATNGGATNGGATGIANGGVSATDLSCRNYCNAVDGACTTANTIQYKSDLSCMNSCATFAPGTLLDKTTNTLGCRLSHAIAAATSPDQNCAAAGPSGGNVCGSNCDGYCTLMLTLCPSVYEDQATCHASCGTMTGIDDIAYHFNQTGDNFQCRIYHATFAAEGSPEIHCVHASPTPATPCAG